MYADFDTQSTLTIVDHDSSVTQLSQMDTPNKVGVMHTPASNTHANDACTDTYYSASDRAAATDLAKAELFDSCALEESATGHYREARVMQEKAMVLRRQVHGEADPRLLQSFSNLGVIAFRQGRLDEATWLFVQVQEIAERRGLKGTPRMARILNDLGVIARNRGDDGEADALYRRALEIKIHQLGKQHLSVASTLINLARLDERAADLEAALARFLRAKEIAESYGSAGEPALIAALQGLGRLYLRQSKLDKARVALEKALRIRSSNVCTPEQISLARFLLATALERTEPTRARALVVLAIRCQQSSENANAENLEAMSAWLTLHDLRQRRQTRRAHA